MKGDIKVYAALLLGVLLIALALAPIDHGWIVLLEWVGAFLVCAGLAFAFNTRVTLCLNLAAFTAGSIGDAWLLGLNPFGWALTNYMLLLHSSLGALTGLLLKK